MDRRTFLSGGICMLASAGVSPGSTLPTRKLGKTNEWVSCLGLGTSDLHALDETDAIRMLCQAHDWGITLFDSAACYGDGAAERRIGKALRRDRGCLFLISKTFARNRAGAWADLRWSLRRLNTDSLDAWLIHDLRTQRDWEDLISPQGAIHAMLQAKQRGYVRFIGFEIHKNFSLIHRVLDEFDFDVAMMPVSTGLDNDSSRILSNGAEPTDLTDAIAAVRHRDIGLLATQVFGTPRKRVKTSEEARDSLRAALSHPIASAVIGCDHLAHLAENIANVW